MAAGNGRLRSADSSTDFETQQLVAAGLTLLQRSATLVRALNGRRSAILLPPSPAFITALAASEGRSALLIDPSAAPGAVARMCLDENVGAVFTRTEFVGLVPDGALVALLDDAPRVARIVSNGQHKLVDLGSHHGLSIDAEADAEGSDEEAIVTYDAPAWQALRRKVVTHATVLAKARAANVAFDCSTSDHMLAFRPWSQLFGFTLTACAPLLAGARVTTLTAFDAPEVLALLARDVTHVVAGAEQYAALLSAMRHGDAEIPGASLRCCVCGPGDVPTELTTRWMDAAGLELRPYDLARP